MPKMRFMASQCRVASRLDFMAALRSSAAFSEKEDGVLEGVALPRVVRDEAHLAAIFAGAPPGRVSAAGGCHH